MKEVLLPQSSKPIGFKHPQNIQQEGLIKEIRSVELSTCKLIFFYIGCVLTVGILYLVSRWWANAWQALKTRPSKPSTAQYFVVYGEDHSETIVQSKRITIRGQEFTVLTYRLYKYYFDEESQSFLPFETKFMGLSNRELLEKFQNGVREGEQYDELVDKYGLNDTEVPDKGIGKTLIDEVLSPFYIFQFCSVLLWYNANYANYATIILLTSLISVGMALYESRTNFIRLQKLSKFSMPINVYRTQIITLNQNRIEVGTAVPKNIDSLELVPGDVIQIQDNMIMPCDAILLNGQCIVNESMLTGESIPMLKTPLQYSTVPYNPVDEGKQATLFAGTLCMETKIQRKGTIPVLAIVTETGFNTLKGQLIRSILFPQSNNFKFYVDSMKFVACMAVVAVIGFCCTVPNKIQTLMDGDITTQDFITEGLDLITITVPPALPTCLQIGITIALSRLQKKGIFCISPPKVNICGKITVMCFDKTGTLTEEGLDLYGIRPVSFGNGQRPRFQPVYAECKKLCQDNNVSFVELETSKNHLKLLPGSNVVEIMAACHGLAYVNGSLIGDPLEVKLFEATGWQLQESQDEGILAKVVPDRIYRKTSNQYNEEKSLDTFIPDLDSVGIIKRFEFSSKLQRMSVIVRNLNTQKNQSYRVHVKGSPEKLRELCRQDSIPASFHKVLDFYAQNGFRVLAVASRILNDVNIDEVQREDVECGLTFLGLVIMQNKLKEVTTEIIDELHEANIRSIMVTGDNVMTAISVARQCGIIRGQQRVYLGELSEKKKQGKYRVQWRDFEMSHHQLNPDSLNPEKFLDDQIEEADEQIDEELKNEQFMLQHTHTDKVGSYLEDYTKKMPKNPSLLEEPPPAHTRASRKASEQVRDSKNYKVEEVEFVEEEEVAPWENDTTDYVLAVSGGAFMHLVNQNQTSLLKNLLNKTQVYARMRPEEKALMVKYLQESDRKPLVCFCGDGANDCAALKGADVGVSLSQAEASIAAPFTSQIQDISCIPLILREGRAALTTSFNCFKFMALYSIIQFAQVTVLYLSSSNLTDNQYLYNDLITIFPLSMTLGFTAANPKLNKYVPGGSLVSLAVLASVIGQGIIVIASQLTMYFLLRSQSWFIPTQEANKYDPSDYNFQVCYENTTLFIFGNYQYIAVTIAFAVGKPFRKPFYTNLWLMASMAVLLACDLCVNFIRWSWSDEWIGLKFEVVWLGETVSQLPQSWLYFILIAAAINSVLIIIFERILIRILAHRKHSHVQPALKQIEIQ